MIKNLVLLSLTIFLSTMTLSEAYEIIKTVSFEINYKTFFLVTILQLFKIF